MFQFEFGVLRVFQVCLCGSVLFVFLPPKGSERAVHRTPGICIQYRAVITDKKVFMRCGSESIMEMYLRYMRLHSRDDALHYEFHKKLSWILPFFMDV